MASSRVIALDRLFCLGLWYNTVLVSGQQTPSGSVETLAGKNPLGLSLLYVVACLEHGQGSFDRHTGCSGDVIDGSRRGDSHTEPRDSGTPLL
jgi:hypothetical protein